MGTQLNKGDRVRLITAGGYDGVNFLPGAYGTVTNVDPEYDHGCMVQVDGEEFSLYFIYDTEIELVAPEDESWDASNEDFADQEILSTASYEVDDDVVRPSHYTQYEVEPIDFIMKNDLPFHVGNIVKYAARAGSKLYEGLDATESEIRDLEKVRRYAEMRVNQLRGLEVL
jgi:hypothetical protein